MPAYREKDRNTWRVSFNYKDWQGKNRTTCKRGFATKREALQYENEFKQKKSGTMDMDLKAFYEVYKEDHYPRIRESTASMKDYIFEDKILPYFGDMKVRDISARDIIKWQNELLKKIDPNTGEKYSKSYLKTIHNQLSAILNFAVRFYQLKENPAKIAGNIGSERDIETEFWTLEEYRKFANEAMKNPEYYYAFETLYWMGIREGEMLALTKRDIDFTNKVMTINKTYQKVRGVEMTGPTKTAKGSRKIAIPDNLLEELKEYMEMIYDLKDTDRIFNMTKSGLYREMARASKAAGVKKIRVHDIRHSHVSLLINLGYSPVAIAERVGHESIYITFRYAHMFPELRNNMAEKLNGLMDETGDE